MPDNLEIKALNRLNAAWGTNYTTWDTSSGSLNDGTNAYGRGSGFMDEDGKSALSAGAFDCRISYIAFDKTGFPSLKQDLDDFVALFAQKYASMVFPPIREKTNNLLALGLYAAPDFVLRAIAPYVDVLWANTDADGSKHFYDVMQRPVFIIDYFTADHDSPNDFGGLITSLSFDPATQRTKITFTGRPYKFSYRWPVEFPDDQSWSAYCQGLYGGSPVPASASWSSLEMWGDYTSCTSIGHRIRVQAQGIYLGLDSPTQNDRALKIIELLDSITSVQGSDGNYFVIGWEHWSYFDRALGDGSEHANFGIVTALDNAYDGVEARKAIGKDSLGHWIGGEDQDYGNLLGPLGNYLTNLYNKLGGAPDSEPPSKVINVKITPVSPMSVSLTWSPATDNIIVAGYKILRKGVVVGNTAKATFQDNGLIPSTSYSYTVLAYDYRGNEGVQSDAAAVTTPPPDTKAPQVSVTGPLPGSTIAGIAPLSASASDEYGISSVQFFIDGNAIGPKIASEQFSFNFDTTLTTNGRHNITAVAKDTSNNAKTSAPIEIIVKNLGLVLAYSFDEGSGTVVHDLSGKQNNGTASKINWTDGKYGRAILFDGTKGVVITPFVDLNAFTIEAWIKPGNGGQIRTIVANSDFGCIPTGFRIYVNHYFTSDQALVVENGDGHNCTGPATPPDTIDLNKWEHIAVVYNGANFSLYNDGVLIPISTSSLNFKKSGALSIGSNNNEFPFTGVIDEFRVYKRALTQDEIIEDMNTPVASLAQSPNVIISGVQASATEMGAAISWFTSLPATHQLEYGTSTSYGQKTPINTNMLTSHLESLDNLLLNTLYHFRILSAVGNITSMSKDFTFTTKKNSQFSLVFPSPKSIVAGTEVNLTYNISANVTVLIFQFDENIFDDLTLNGTYYFSADYGVHRIRAIATVNSQTARAETFFALVDKLPSNDYDNDKISNTLDKCPFTPHSLRNNVDIYGCPLPFFSKFSPELSTNFSKVDLTSIAQLDLGIRNKGKIEFGSPVMLVENYSDFSSPVDLNTLVDIQQNKVVVHSDLYGYLNVPATITLFNVSNINPVIKVESNTCTQCKILLFGNKTIVFTVPHFTEYSVAEGSYCGDDYCSVQESCSNCAGDCGSCAGNTFSSGGSGGGGAGGGAGGSGGGGTFNICNYEWHCDSWGTCSNGVQSRICVFAKVAQHSQTNSCDVGTKAPSMNQNCDATTKSANTQYPSSFGLGKELNQITTEEKREIQIKSKKLSSIFTILALAFVFIAIIGGGVMEIKQFDRKKSELGVYNGNRMMIDYIKRMRSNGFKDFEIRRRLVNAGWNPDDVEKALTDYPL